MTMASKRTEPGAIGESSKTVKRKQTVPKKRKKALKETSFMEYLNNSSLVSEYFLTENKNLSFHWSNWSETCQYQKEYLFKDVANEVKLKNLNDELADLKKTEVWLKNKRGCVKMSLYDIYEGYLDNRLRMTWFERDGILLSFENEAGPYTSLTNMKWFNKNIYSAFMFRKLLTKQIPFRGFRVGLSAKMEGRFDSSPLNTAEVTLHQASEYGVILKLAGRNNLSKLNNSTSLELTLDATPFLQVKDHNFDQIIEKFGNYDFASPSNENIKTISLDTSIMKKFNNDRNAVSGDAEFFYFFVPYTELFKDPEHKDLKGAFNQFVVTVKEELDTQIKKAA